MRYRVTEGGLEPRGDVTIDYAPWTTGNEAGIGNDQCGLSSKSGSCEPRGTRAQAQGWQKIYKRNFFLQACARVHCNR